MSMVSGASPLSRAPLGAATRAWAWVQVSLLPMMIVAVMGVSTGAASAEPGLIGPYNVSVWAGGAGVEKPISPTASAVQANAPFTLTAWVSGVAPSKGPIILVSLGRPDQPQARELGLDGGCLFVKAGDLQLQATKPLAGPGLHLVALIYDGHRISISQDGETVLSQAAGLPTVPPPTPANPWDLQPNTLLEIAPLDVRAPANQHFDGRVADVTVYARALSAGDLLGLAQTRPDWRRTVFETGSKPWPVQLRQQAGYDAPQDPSTLPQSRAPFGAPQVHAPYAGPALVADGGDVWTLKGGWRLAAEGDVKVKDGAAISSASFDASAWYVATVPGTVLTTLVDRGVYPDPAIGLNNLAIPETLNKQAYWYRTEITAPAALKGRHVLLTFDGVNYAAEVWLNGARLGDMRGAFIRGQFDVTTLLRSDGSNVLAVRVSPPPHPGIPNEQSIKGGPGENGGIQMLDGPTFVATEGWDWIPGVRDRNTGIWQDVTLSATGDVRIEDPQVVTTMPLPDVSSAKVTIKATLENLSPAPVQGVLTARFDDIAVNSAITLAPGRTTVTLSPTDYRQLQVAHPRLWWPNGYGEPALHDLHLSFAEGGGISDSKTIRFGIREITYELSAFDADGRLRRVDVDPAKSGGYPVIDGDHEHIHKTINGYAVSLHPGALDRPGVTLLPDDPLSPFLVIKVNGVRIAVRGGAWGMDDFMKRVSKDRLEPFFKLNRDAHMNILRNWVGQDTEEALYDLADKYGLLIWNDFWESTQDYNLETDQEDLFLKNAADVIRRYRNHPSIAIWIGRNEGVPQPSLNVALEQITRELDGTRYYAGSSNRINLQDSGPYDYREPEAYFTGLSRGFAVEVGTPSFSTLEAFKASIPEADRWPISDDWAYHDWHQSGNGDTKSYMASLTTKFGAPTSLEDFDRKAQMLQYDSYRAIFEGLNAHLWTENSGRMLWMTQPAWPSNTWQIYTSDYDTAAPYYAVMKAAEPVHAQLNLPDFALMVANTTLQPLTGLRLHARVVRLDDSVVLDRTDTLSVGADAVTRGPSLDLAPAMTQGPVLVKLELKDSTGETLSQSFYWEAAKPADLRRLESLPKAPVDIELTPMADKDHEHRLSAQIHNAGATAALEVKLTLQNSAGARILPAYYSDNYVSLLPGERRTILIRYPDGDATQHPQIAVRGFNVTAQTVTEH
jgi:hypothetical protein